MIDNSNTPTVDKIFPEIKENRLKVQRAVVDKQNRDVKKAMLRSVLPSVAVGALDLAGNSFLQDKAQHYYKENQHQLFRLQQQSQVNAAYNEVEGLRRAGLSTALAGSPTAMSIGAVSSPQASSHAPAPESGFGKVDAERALMEQSMRLSQAEINLKNAQAEEQNLINRDLAANQGMASTIWGATLNAMANRAEDMEQFADAEFIRSLKAVGNELRTTGGLDALVHGLQSMGAYSMNYAEARSAVLSSEVLDEQLNKDMASELAIAPFLQNNVWRAQYKELCAQAALFYSDIEVNKHQVKVLDEQVNNLVALTKKTYTEDKQIRNNDSVTAMVEGNEDVIRANIVQGVGHTLQNVAGLAPLAVGRAPTAVASGRVPVSAAPKAGSRASRAPESPVFRSDAKGGAARKAEAAADRKAAQDTWDSFYKGYKSAQRYRGEHSDYPKRKPKPKSIF